MKTLALILVLAACSSPFVPDFTYFGRESFTPPPFYATWYKMVEDCWGQRGNYNRVRWFVADRIEDRDPLTTVYATILGDDITIRRGREMYPRTVKHEMSHHVMPWLGGAIHYEGAARAICDDAGEQGER